MKKDESGFSTVVILLVLVAVGLIAGIGWYVWDKNNSSNDGNMVNNEGAQDNHDSVIKRNFTLYGSADMVLQYPYEWIQYTESKQPGWVFFKSLDYEPATELGPSAKAGYLLEVRRSKSLDGENYEADLKNYSSNQKVHGGSYETIHIDGEKAVLSDIKTHGTYWHATTYYNDQTYLFRLNAPDEDKPEVKELFLDILETVKFNRTTP